MGWIRKTMETRADRQELQIAEQEAEQEIKERKERARLEVERRKAEQRRR